MPYPARLLNDGESIVVSTRTHPKALVLPVLVLLLTLAVAGWLTTVGDGTTGKVLHVVTWVLAAAVLVWWVLRPFLAWWTTSYTFTTRRFIKRSGFIAKEGRTIPLNRISGVDFEIGVIDRIFRCGTLVVSDASEQGRVELHDVPRVEQVHLTVANVLHQLSERRSADDGA